MWADVESDTLLLSVWINFSIKTVYLLGVLEVIHVHSTD